MRSVIAILEDNDDRTNAMRDCLADKFPFFETVFFRSAATMIDWLRENLPRAICIVLDHDLEPAPADPPGSDPGTGRDVSDFLLGFRPLCPVVVHSSNVHAAIAMEQDLAEAGWAVERLLPYGDLEWIAAEWLPRVRNAIVHAQREDAGPSVAAASGILGTDKT
jgi:hypothetical protein